MAAMSKISDLSGISPIVTSPLSQREIEDRISSLAVEEIETFSKRVIARVLEEHSLAKDSLFSTNEARDERLHKELPKLVNLLQKTFSNPDQFITEGCDLAFLFGFTLKLDLEQTQAKGDLWFTIQYDLDYAKIHRQFPIPPTAFHIFTPILSRRYLFRSNESAQELAAKIDAEIEISKGGIDLALARRNQGDVLTLEMAILQLGEVFRNLKVSYNPKKNYFKILDSAHLDKTTVGKVLESVQGRYPFAPKDFQVGLLSAQLLDVPGDIQFDIVYKRQADEVRSIPSGWVGLSNSSRYYKI